MKISKSYPYPVLCSNNDDYINSSFEADIKAKPEFGTIRIDVNFKLNDETIAKLIEEEQACFIVHVQCSPTSFRNVYFSYDTTLSISIDESKIRKNIEVYSFIVAKEQIQNYNNLKLNPFYNSIPIHFEKGNFIAIGQAEKITVQEEDISLMDLPSIVKIHKGEGTEYMQVDYEISDEIIVTLPEEIYNRYTKYGNFDLKYTILSLIIMPVLVDLFASINEMDDLSDKTWYQVLEKKFKESGYELSDIGSGKKLEPLVAAQMILKKPMNRSFDEIDELMEKV